MNIEICDGTVQNLEIRTSNAGKSSISVATFNFGNVDDKFDIRGIPDNYDKIKNEYLIEGDKLVIAYNKNLKTNSTVYYFYNKKTGNLKGANWILPAAFLVGMSLIFVIFYLKINSANGDKSEIFAVFTLVIAIISPIIILIIWMLRARLTARLMIKKYLRGQ